MSARRVILFHGTGATPETCWYPWIAERLRARGYLVEVPHHPGINVDPIAEFLPGLLAAHTFDDETILIGHSGGAALLLAVLEHVEVVVPQAILVAGYATPPNDEDEPVLQETYDWNRIRSHVQDLWFLNSVTDMFGCDADHGRAMFDRLGGTLVIRDDDHFVDDTLPLLDRITPDPA